jgi:hypothetical protein
MQALESASEVVAPLKMGIKQTIRWNLEVSRIVEKQMSQIGKNINDMQKQVEEFRATTDVKERRMLMQEHRLVMQASLKAMREMGV